MKRGNMFSSPPHTAHKQTLKNQKGFESFKSGWERPGVFAEMNTERWKREAYNLGFGCLMGKYQKKKLRQLGPL